jgi:hypothetical protein
VGEFTLQNQLRASAKLCFARQKIFAEWPASEDSQALMAKIFKCSRKESNSMNGQFTRTNGINERKLYYVRTLHKPELHLTVCRKKR